MWFFQSFKFEFVSTWDFDPDEDLYLSIQGCDLLIEPLANGATNGKIKAVCISITHCTVSHPVPCLRLTAAGLFGGQLDSLCLGSVRVCFDFHSSFFFFSFCFGAE